MTERQEKILIALTKEYINSAEPISSEKLIERYKLPYSSATIRAELAELEEQGFLAQPHTSAGRIPTETAYRHYVDKIMPNRGLSRHDALVLKSEILNLTTKYNRLARGTAKLLADLSQNLAFAGMIERDEFHEAGFPELFKEPEITETEYMLDITKALETLDDKIDEIIAYINEEPQVFIGRENPYMSTKKISLLITTCDLPSGEKGLLGIIGPMRMKYERNIQLLEIAANTFKNIGSQYE